MALEYFPCYDSYLSKLSRLSDQEVGRLFRALMHYHITGERQELTGRESMAYDFIVDDINRAAEAYEEKCERLRANGQKGANASKSPQKPPEAGQSKSKSKSNTSKTSKKETEKEKKTPRGEFQNVLLTDTELQKLQDKFGSERTARAVNFLSSYIVEKKYKSESHYLAMLRWVFDAVAEKDQKRPPVPMGGAGEIGDAEREALRRLMED